MSSTSINLLPPEVLLERRQSSKLSLVNKLSVGAMVLLVFITSATLVLRLSQNLALKEAKEGLVYAQGKVTDLKDKEGQFVLLKQRLAEIQQLTGGDAKKKAVLSLLISLSPPEVYISDFILDNRGAITMTMESSSLITIDRFITNLSSPEKNLNLISRVDLDNLALGKSNIYSFSLKILTN